VFYPDGLPQAKELEYAASHLTSIEINATFYGSQKPASFRKWAATVPDGFVFSVKGPRFATNRRVPAEAGDSIQRFLDSGVLELGDRLGPLLLQFAPTKKFDPADFGKFLELLPAKAGSRALRHVVEVRHPSFRAPDFVALVRSFHTPVFSPTLSLDSQAFMSCFIVLPPALPRCGQRRRRREPRWCVFFCQCPNSSQAEKLHRRPYGVGFRCLLRSADHGLRRGVSVNRPDRPETSLPLQALDQRHRCGRCADFAFVDDVDKNISRHRLFRRMRRVNARQVFGRFTFRPNPQALGPCV